jgi:hypothetical protein
MMLGSLADALWILCSILPAIDHKDAQEIPFYQTTAWVYFSTTLMSILTGLGEAVQWVAQGKYMSDCATTKTKGFFFGYFWAFYMAS